MGAKYIGTEVGLVRIDDRPLKPGDVVDGPPDLVAELLQRSDFQESGASKQSSAAETLVEALRQDGEE